MYTSSIPCSCNDVNIAWVCTESNALIHRCIRVIETNHLTVLTCCYLFCPIAQLAMCGDTLEVKFQMPFVDFLPPVVNCPVLIKVVFDVHRQIV